MPPAGSGGMDGTHEWGRLYWGGATFWLEAEIAIYRQSGGRFLLCDAMRAVNRQSGGNSVDWAPEKMMAVGDKATGTTALTNLYQKFSSQAFDGRLAELFERLGVAMDSSGSIRFDQGAELATLTRLITLPLHRG
jgi:predicted metalloprotease with PDZ domain